MEDSRRQRQVGSRRIVLKGGDEMKIEITTGTENTIPMDINTFIKLNGKEVSNCVDYLRVEFEVNEPVKWLIGLKGQKKKVGIQQLIKSTQRRAKRIWTEKSKEK